MQTSEKTCFKCGGTKSLTEFYPHKRMADGRLNKCKECTKKDAFNDRHYKFRERVLQYDRERYQNNPERRAKAAEMVKRNYRNHPERRAANTKVRRAVMKGIIVKHPCLVCGKEKVEGHHPDYSRPLDVVWLCAEHHKQAHAIKV